MVNLPVEKCENTQEDFKRIHICSFLGKKIEGGRKNFQPYDMCDKLYKEKS